MFQEKDKILTTSILEKVEEYEQKGKLTATLDFKTLYQLLTGEEQEFARRIKDLKPINYGFLGPHYGILPVPKDLVLLRDQRYQKDGKTEIISAQLVPPKVHNAYVRLNRAMGKSISKAVLVESGYRSPAYQLVVFIDYLKFHKWDLHKTVERVALPGYSEHGYPPRQALDFITTDGIPSDEDPFEFANTSEYQWLSQHAQDFNFYLSYPEDNKWGVMFEPWHWAFIE